MKIAISVQQSKYLLMKKIEQSTLYIHYLPITALIASCVSLKTFKSDNNFRPISYSIPIPHPINFISPPSQTANPSLYQIRCRGWISKRLYASSRTRSMTCMGQTKEMENLESCHIFFRRHQEPRESLDTAFSEYTPKQVIGVVQIPDQSS
jgi:hypothetical protein